MFVRTVSTPNSPRRSIQIVASQRIGDKVKQKIVRYVGIAMNETEEAKLKAFAEEIIVQIIKEREESSAQGSLFEYTESDAKNAAVSAKSKALGRKKHKQLEDILPPDQVSLSDVFEEKRIIDGVDDIAGMMYDFLEFNTLFPATEANRSNKMLKDLVLSRLVYRYSKSKLCKTMLKEFDKEYSEDQIYRLMDKLHPQITQIKQTVFKKSQSLLPNVNVVLFDVTTLYCESITPDGLREFGFSKDGKFNNTQIVLALATNELGLPLGYELFEGNCAEVKTLINTINQWKEIFDIKSACFIGDRAMFSKDNIELIEAMCYEYIIACKLRTLSDELQNQILDETNYKLEQFKDDVAWVGEFKYLGNVDYYQCEILSEIPESLETYRNRYIAIKHDEELSIKYVDDSNQVMSSAPSAETASKLSSLRNYSKCCTCKVVNMETLTPADKINLVEDIKVDMLIGYYADKLKIYYNGDTIDINKSDERYGQLISCIRGYKVQLYNKVKNVENKIIVERIKNDIVLHFIDDYKKPVTKNISEFNLNYQELVTLDDETLIDHIETFLNDPLNNITPDKLYTSTISHKIPNKLMKSLFANYTSNKYVSVPHELMQELFADYNPTKRRICVSYKASRARRDTHKRELILNKLKNKTGNPNQVTKTIAKKYMTINGNSQLDDNKISNDEMWDGMHGVITNVQDEAITTILNKYSNLWRIEEAFRINKHNLGMRPIYHYKKERIEAHIAICYMAFTTLKFIQYQTQLTQSRYTIDNILETMLSVQSNIYTHKVTKDQYKMPGSTSNEARILYQAFGIKRNQDASIYIK